jgi:nucleoside 2-deoxyribosyltransferase
VVVRDLAKVEARVRFPYPAPSHLDFFCLVSYPISGEYFLLYRVSAFSVLTYRRARVSLQCPVCLNCARPAATKPFRLASGVLAIVVELSRFAGTPRVKVSFPTLMLAYLCGPIEFAEDGGRLWRRKLAPFLRDQLGHRVYDPAEDEHKNLTQEEAEHFREWKTTDLERFRRAVRKIIAFDLDLIENRADYLICCWDAPAKSGGTSAELTVAYRKGIPVYLVSSLPVEEISGWMLGCSDQLFSSVEDLKNFLAARFSRERQDQLWKG